MKGKNLSMILILSRYGQQKKMSYYQRLFSNSFFDSGNLKRIQTSGISLQESSSRLLKKDIIERENSAEKDG